MTGANIILILFIFVFIMLISGSTLKDFFKFIIAPFRLIGKSYKENVSSKKHIEKEVEFPSHPVCSKRKFIDIPDDQISDNITKIKNNTNHFDIPLDDNTSKEINQKNSKKILLSLDENKFDKTKKNSIETSLDQKNLIDNLVKKVALDMSLNSNKDNDNISKKSLLKQQKEEEIQEMKDELEAANVKYIIEEEYKIPPLTFLKKFVPTDNEDISQELKGNAERLVDTLKSFGVQTRVIDISRGPAVTRYELQPSAGVKISKITNLSDDIALNLATAGVRIEAPIPNKAAVGIEVPNKNVDIVTLREIIESDDFKNSKSKLTVALGKDITGNMAIADLSKMPHTLIAGSTGSGKSVCINSIIVSILYKSSPEEVKIVMIDPKVVELGIYNGIPHLLVPVVTDPRKAAGALNWAVTEMLNRYKIFADSGVRDLAGYNKFANKKDDIKPMPQIVIIIDELADLMMAAPNEVEDAICRLAQMARAAGMHLVIATQRPSVDVITGVIKANIPSRIAFAVSSQVDSRTILDGSGAEKLLGRGDMLFAPMGSSKPTRVQGCFVSDTEVEQVVSFIKNKDNPDYDEEIIHEIEKQSVVANQKEKNSGDNLEDAMLMPAIRCIIESGQASTSYLQRKLKLGYARAARIIDDLEDRGIVGPYEGGKRKVIMSKQDFLEMNINIDNN
ncbi:MAG: DNA translocase FtsK [Oscillospiraceae bacterium]|nr:DNA translocase FtsK [Oscillospiraceae bacterium]